MPCHRENSQIHRGNRAAFLVRDEGVARESRGSVVAATAGGTELTVKAKAFVAAVGGLEVVRLLGVSIPSSAAVHDNLGRHYMCHLEGTFGELALRPAKRNVAFGFERTRDGVYARRRLTIREEVQRSDGLLNLAIRLHHPNVVDPRHGLGVLSAMYVTKQLILPEYRRKLSMVTSRTSWPSMVTRRPETS